MLDLIKELNNDSNFFKNIAIACGGNHSFSFLCVDVNLIKGIHTIHLPNKKIGQVCYWDRFGFPVDLQKYPSKYYTRLLVRTHV
jgi:hypothetical protein